jgi:fluoride exporter
MSAGTLLYVALGGAVVVGFCGGFTTFSTFSWQTLDQMLKGQWGMAAANVLLSVTVCLAAVWLGFRLGRV